jgi:hypothetical protein
MITQAVLAALYPDAGNEQRREPEQRQRELVELVQSGRAT